MHRADLLQMLAAPMPGVTIELGARVEAVSSNEKQAVVTLGGGRQYEADLIVGCDGINSLVRKTLHGAQSPRFTGNMCWRALTPADIFPRGLVAPDMTIWMGPLGHIVVYYIRGGQFVNMVASRETENWVEESWSVESSAAEMSAAFPSVGGDMRMLIDRAQRCFKWGLFDRDPLPWWSRGRITLLGDAAHPMLPFLAQGAAMAIEDAFVLARELGASPDDLAAALQRYEAIRRPRTSDVQLAARAQAGIFHLTSPAARLKRFLKLDRFDQARSEIAQPRLALRARRDRRRAPALSPFLKRIKGGDRAPPFPTAAAAAALLDDPHDVGLLHDQEFLALELDLGPRPFAEQHAVPGLHVHRHELAALVAPAGPDRDHFALLRLLLGGVRDDDAALGLRAGIDAAHDDTVMQGAEFVSPWVSSWAVPERR